MNERGSIEARRMSSEYAPSRSAFPRLNERGSIEARLHGTARGIPVAFPRLNERGSIEAYRTRAVRERRRLRFHV